MAMRDRIRERFRGQKPVGAAEGMTRKAAGFGADPLNQRGAGAGETQGFGGGRDPISRNARPGTGGGSGRVAPYGGPSDGDVDMLVAPQTTGAAEAARMGERMGTESLMRMMGLSPERQAELRGELKIMNAQRLNEATRILMKYKAGKASVNARVIKAQQWWKLKNWQQIKADRGTKGATTHPGNTGWLWNCIVGKHADAIDSYPEPVILPRMEDDKGEAEKLSKIVPVVMEMNDFEETYNACSWQKMQEGTGVYGVFWNSSKLNGLGDIDIKKVNILNLIWEPGVNDIEDSRNVFFVSYEDKQEMEQAYPELQGRLNSTGISIEDYKTDDNKDTGNQVVVVDWYYKKHVDSRTILHYCKYCGETCLYSSEEEGLEAGYYEDGEYPFVLDGLFPVEGSPAAYGYIDIAKDTQADIDTISEAMVLNAAIRARPRYFGKKDGSINEEEFADTSKPIVHVNGNLSRDSLIPVEVPVMGSDAHNMLQQKIDEIKFITGNTDVNNGGVPSGVTAASAIAALKEDSGRSSKDSTKASYRAYRKIVIKVIERIRQFYDIPRQFRIIGPQGEEEFVPYDNRMLQPQMIMNLHDQEPGMRLPVFDIEVRAQRENAYTKMSQNELAIQLFQMGAFNPQLTDQIGMMLDMMDFKGIEEIRRKVRELGTMQDAMMKLGQMSLMLAQQARPDLVPQIAMMLQEMGAEQGLMPAGGGIRQQLQAPADNMSAPNPNENGIVRNARERAANASRPA